MWHAITRVDQYEQWWPALRTFDGRALAAGDTWHSVLRSPMLFTMALSITIEDVEPLRSVDASLTGDIEGRARIELTDAAGASTDHCDVRMTSSLVPRRRSLRIGGLLLPGPVRASHDHVLNSGADLFADRALSLTEGPALVDHAWSRTPE